MFGLGWGELLIILVIVVLIFGAGKIPELGKGLGEGIKNFKRGLKEGEDARDDIARLPPRETVRDSRDARDPAPSRRDDHDDRRG